MSMGVHACSCVCACDVSVCVCDVSVCVCDVSVCESVCVCVCVHVCVCMNASMGEHDTTLVVWDKCVCVT